MVASQHKLVSDSQLCNYITIWVPLRNEYKCKILMGAQRAAFLLVYIISMFEFYKCEAMHVLMSVKIIKSEVKKLYSVITVYFLQVKPEVLWYVWNFHSLSRNTEDTRRQKPVSVAEHKVYPAEREHC